VKPIGIVVTMVTVHQVFVWPNQCVVPASPDSPHVIVSSSIIDHLDWTTIFSILTMVVIVWMSNSPGFCERDTVARRQYEKQGMS